MANIGTLFASVAVRTEGLKRGLRDANKDFTSFTQKSSRSMRKVGTSVLSLSKRLVSLQGILVGVGGVLAVRKFVQVADSMSLVESRLKLVTSSAEELTDVQDRLLKIANETRTEFTSVGDLYARLGRTTKTLNVTQEDLLQVTKTINQALIVSGASSIEAGAALTQLSQGLASGALRGDELRSVLEQTPRLAIAIAEGLGVTIGKLRELGAAGELSAGKVIKALLSQKEIIASEFGAITATVGQSFIVLGNSVSSLIFNVDKGTDITKTFSDVILKLAERTDGLKNALNDSDSTLNAFIDTMRTGASVGGIFVQTLRTVATEGLISSAIQASVSSVKDLIRIIDELNTGINVELHSIKDETLELKRQLLLRQKALNIQERMNMRRGELLPLDALPVEKELAKITDAMRQAAKKWAQTVRTPFEVMEQEIDKITKLLDTKLITQATFDKASKQISDSFLKATKTIKKDKKDLDTTFTKNMSFLDELVRETARSMQQSFSNLFFKVAKNEFEDFGEFLENLWDSVLLSISNKLAENVSGKLEPVLNDLSKKVGNIFGITTAGATSLGGTVQGGQTQAQAGQNRLTKSVNQTQIAFRNLGNVSENVFIQMDRRIQEKINHIDTGLIPAIDDSTFALKLMETQARLTAAAVASIGSGAGAGGFGEGGAGGFGGLGGGGGGGVGSGGVGGAASGAQLGGSVGGPLGAVIGGLAGFFLEFQHGGIVPGAVGAPVPAIVHGGERVLTPDMRNMLDERKPDDGKPIIVKVILNNPIDPQAFGKSDEEIVTVVTENYARGAILREVIRNDIGGS